MNKIISIGIVMLCLVTAVAAESSETTTNSVSLWWTLLIILIGSSLYATQIKSLNESTTSEVSDVQQYLRAQLAKGIEVDEITQALINVGWKKQGVEAEINTIFSEEEPNQINNQIAQNIQEYVTTLHFQNTMHNELIAKLQQQGWEEKHLSMATSHLSSLQQLKQCIADWQLQGYQKKEIQEHLYQQGWSVYIIYEMLK